MLILCLVLKVALSPVALSCWQQMAYGICWFWQRGRATALHSRQQPTLLSLSTVWLLVGLPAAATPCSARALQAPAEDTLAGAQRALQASETLNGAQRALEAADHHLNRAMDDRTAFAAARRALNEARRLADAAMAQTSQQGHGRHGSGADPPAAAGERSLRAARDSLCICSQQGHSTACTIRHSAGARARNVGLCVA